MHKQIALVTVVLFLSACGHEYDPKESLRESRLNKTVEKMSGSWVKSEEMTANYCEPVRMAKSAEAECAVFVSKGQSLRQVVLRHDGNHITLISLCGSENFNLFNADFYFNSSFKKEWREMDPDLLVRNSYTDEEVAFQKSML